MSFLIGQPMLLRHQLRDVTRCAVAPGQSLVATALQNGTIFLWEPGQAKVLTEIPHAHKGTITGLSFNHAGSVLASCGQDGELIMWDFTSVEGGARKRRLDGQGCPLNCCQFSSSSALLATGGTDCDVMLWGHMGQPICGRLRGHNNWVMCVAFLKDSTMCASGGFDYAICLWNCVRFTIIRTLRPSQSPICSLAISIEGSVLAAGTEDGLVYMLRLSDGTVLRELRGHSGTVSGLVFVESIGVILSSGFDTSIKVWSLRGRCLKSFRAHSASILSLSVSTEGDFFCSAGADSLAKVVPFHWEKAPDEDFEIEYV